MIRVDDRLLFRRSRGRYGQVEKSVLSTVMLVGEVARVDGRVDVQFRRVRLVPCGRRVTGTFDGEGKDDCVSVRHRLVLGGFYQQKATTCQNYSHPSSLGNLALGPTQIQPRSIGTGNLLGLPVQQPGVKLDRKQPQSMGQHLVLHDRRIVVHVHRLDGDRRYLGDERTTERIGDGCVDADEVEFDAGRGQALGF